MGKGKASGKSTGKSTGKAQVARLPKKKCCVATTRCKRCPLRMLKEGTLPAGYTVKKRRLVKVGVTVTGGKKSGKKSDRAA